MLTERIRYMEGRLYLNILVNIWIYCFVSSTREGWAKKLPGSTSNKSSPPYSTVTGCMLYTGNCALYTRQCLASIEYCMHRRWSVFMSCVGVCTSCVHAANLVCKERNHVFRCSKLRHNSMVKCLQKNQTRIETLNKLKKFIITTRTQYSVYLVKICSLLITTKHITSLSVDNDHG